MIILFAIAVVLIVAYLIKKYSPGTRQGLDNSRPPDNMLPSSEEENDKLIIVSNVGHDEIKKALTTYCNTYNKENFAVLPRLWQLSPNSFAISFPYNINFTMLCYTVNFLSYPIDFEGWNGEVYAWTTTTANDEWITNKSANKKVVLFMAKDDTEYDNVFLTTEDNIGYKLGFGLGEEKQLLSTPNELYKAPAVQLNELKDKLYEDFK